MDTASLIAQARKVRDDSINEVTPPLAALPDPLPKNVMSLFKENLTEEEIKITSYDVPGLLEIIGGKVYSCETVTRAFLRRAALAQKLTNCVTTLLPAKAIARAKYLDTLDCPLGPLHGLPMSVKEHHGMADEDTNGGYVAWIAEPRKGHCSVNDVFYEAGCVFYARTTQPQAIMHLETSTNIYGVTVNPWNTTLTSGGSSGGESALVACRGSVLGIGGDIGGSIRCPAANTGVYGFKPTPGRMGRQGSHAVVNGQEGIMPTEGPLSTSRAGLELFMTTYLSYSPWIKDDYLVPIPWRSVTLPPKLKIAILWDDGIVRPHPPITRALREVKDKLEAAGMEIVDWVPQGHDECWDLTQALYYEDGGRQLEALIEKGGERMLPLTEWLVKGNENVKYRTVEDIQDLKTKRGAYRALYNRLCLSTGVDAILCPVGPGAAPPLGQSKYWSYTSQWNLLEYPGAVFPVTTVSQDEDLEETDYVPRNEKDKFNWELYRRERYVDAPVGLQIVCRRWEDEKCLAVLAEVERAMGRL
ncbi:related to general amidase [Rhynchosporium agropyri]|uniref:amidase n=1 Tax=Rhynchosporium agropyri TaxID=914238 RepID=A0A1E1KBY1_9HELO|nr:related to general amidase [Rhynchosporium agropyri]